MPKIKESPLERSFNEAELKMSIANVKRRRSEGNKSTPNYKNKYNGSSDPDLSILKYYYQRYSLFSKYDAGIQLDHESWFSVTPENIAKHIAERFLNCLGDKEEYVIVDGMCGCGGNVIQFARVSPKVRVIAIEIVEERINMARNNAKVYGVEEQCDFKLGDFCEIMKTLGPIDAVFLSPPWGGIDYIENDKYSLNSMTPNGYDLIRECRKYLSHNIAMLLPRNVDKNELKKTLGEISDADSETLFDLEENRVGKKVKTITAYFGGLLDPTSLTDSDTDW